MSTLRKSLFRIALTCFVFTLVVSALPQSLLAQDTNAAVAVVKQANSDVTMSVGSNFSPTKLTRATLTTRHEKLVELFHNHPESVRSLALSPDVRAKLLQAEPSYSALVEQDIPLTGELTSSVADDFVHHTSTKQYTLHTWTGDRALSFTAARPDVEHFLNRKVTVTGLSLPEIVAAETLRNATPEETQTEAATKAAVVHPDIPTPAASLPFTGVGVPAGAATLLGSDFGNQTIAVLILKFAASTATYPTGWDQQSLYARDFNGPGTPNVNEYTKEVSYNQASTSTDVYGPITVPGTYDCSTTDAMGTAAITAAVAAGLDVSKYNHFVLVYPVATCYFGGLGSAGPVNAIALIPHQYTYIWLPVTPEKDINDPFYLDFLWYAQSQHEFGHNLGMGHSNSLDFGALSLGPLDFASVNPGTVTPGGHAPDTDSASGIAAPDTNVPFLPKAAGQPSGSTQITAVNTEYGDNFAGMGDPQGPYNANHRTSIIGWIPPSGNQDVTSSGAFTLVPAEQSSGLRTLHVLRDPASSSWVWVEYHQPIGIYTPRSESHDPLDLHPNTLYTGAQLHYQNGLTPGDTHTLLMDMTPVSQPNNFYDNNLAPGASWSDPFSLLTITTGTQSATSLGVTVSYDTPCATVTLNSATIPTAGGTGTVTITAPSTCNWSVSSNAAWISFPGATSGTGNGSVSFVSTANTAPAQRNSYITAQRQSLPIMQSGTGISILPRTPVTAPVGTFVPLTFNIVDNLGFADLSELDLTINGGTQRSCSITTVSSTNADGTTSNGDLFFTLAADGTTSPYGHTGVAGIISNSYCSIDAGASTYVAQGKTATLTLMVSFPASYTGTHSVYGVGSGSTSGALVPLSYVNVTAANAAKPSAAINPSSSSAPLTGSADSLVPFTITGANTNFSAGTTVTFSGKGIKVKEMAVINPTTITGSFAVKDSAPTGPQSVVITSGSEVATVPFIVKPADTTPGVSLSPSSGVLGTKVAVTITGTNTNFTADSTVSASGNRLAVNKVKFVSATELTAEFNIDADGDAGSRVITVTSGSEIDTATFTVTPAAIPEITISPATGNQGDFAFVTVSGENTNFNDTTTVGIPGTDIKITDINVANATTLTAKFKMTSTATAGARVVNITTGTEVVKGTFTVTGYVPTTTAITAPAAAMQNTQTMTLTATVTPSTGTGTPTGYVSFLEDKGGVGLEDILGTVALNGGIATLPVSNLSVGAHTFSAQYLGDNASFAPSNSTTKAKVDITSSGQTITFAALPNVVYGAAPITLTASASSSLKVSYTVTGPATVFGSTLTITGAGAVAVTASQAGNSNYPAATPVTQTFTVSPAPLTVTANNATRGYGLSNPCLHRVA